MRGFSHRCSNMYEDDFTDLPGKSNAETQREDTDHSREKKNPRENRWRKTVRSSMRQKSEINESVSGLLSGRSL